MFTSPDPKSPLFEMVAGIVNAHAALVRAQPPEPRITRIDFEADPAAEALTERTVAAKVRLVRAGPALLEAAQAAWSCIGELPPTQARVEVAQMLQAAIEEATGSAE